MDFILNYSSGPENKQTWIRAATYSNNSMEMRAMNHFHHWRMAYVAEDIHSLEIGGLWISFWRNWALRRETRQQSDIMTLCQDRLMNCLQPIRKISSHKSWIAHLLRVWEIKNYFLDYHAMNSWLSRETREIWIFLKLSRNIGRKLKTYQPSYTIEVRAQVTGRRSNQPWIHQITKHVFTWCRTHLINLSLLTIPMAIGKKVWEITTHNCWSILRVCLSTK